jgi:hypothetical protein
VPFISMVFNDCRTAAISSIDKFSIENNNIT